MPATKKVPATEIQPDAVSATDASPADNLYFDAQEEKNGLTLVPEDKVAGNQTVEAVLIDGQPVTREGFTVVRHK